MGGVGEGRDGGEWSPLRADAARSVQRARPPRSGEWLDVCQRTDNSAMAEHDVSLELSSRRTGAGVGVWPNAEYAAVIWGYQDMGVLWSSRGGPRRFTRRTTDVGREHTTVTSARIEPDAERLSSARIARARAGLGSRVSTVHPRKRINDHNDASLGDAVITSERTHWRFP
jgi:hypothetical protein